MSSLKLKAYTCICLMRLSALYAKPGKPFSGFVTFVTEKATAFYLLYGMINKMATRTEKWVIWFSRILRWLLGTGLISLSYQYAKDDYAWVLLVFGVLLIITGFFRPKRCLDENCKI
jgi:hypothetical protein